MEINNCYIKYELFNDLPSSDIFHGFMYEEKESLGLTNFVSVIMEKYSIHDIDKWLELTLDYLRPLLQSWKVIVKVTNPKSEKWREYKIFDSSETDEAMKLIKEMWLWIDDKEKRSEFIEFNVQFKLPDWWFLY